MPFLRFAALALAIAAVGSAGAGDESPSVAITVTRFDDPRPPDGCSPADCSLREAIILANNVPGRDMILLPAGTYDLWFADEWYEEGSLTGDLDIIEDVVVTGSGASATIITGYGERAFDIGAAASVQMSGLSISGIPYYFAPIDCGRGIRNRGTLLLTNAVISGNAMRGDGGGICNEGGTLTVRDSTIAGNCACFAGAGGGIYNIGTATLERVWVVDNYLHLRDGGGIASGGSLTVTDSVIAGNWTDAPFGERRGGGVSAGGTVTFTNVTISGNRTSATDSGIGEIDSRGGGLSLFSGDVTLTNVTVSDNDSGTTAGGVFFWDYWGTGTLTLVNTIIAGNTGGDCEGTVASGGHNIDGDGSCGLGAAGDLPNTDPLLGPLADNGGPTQTHALLAGSPAIDAGDGTACPAGDQRGYLRPAGSGCDIGAYEYDALLPSPTTSPSPTPTWSPIARGDADCDEDVDPVDALAALRLTAGLGTDAGCLLAANVDCSLAVDSVDALFILRYAAALPVTLPPGCPAIGQG